MWGPEGLRPCSPKWRQKAGDGEGFLLRGSSVAPVRPAPMSEGCPFPAIGLWRKREMKP